MAEVERGKNIRGVLPYNLRIKVTTKFFIDIIYGKVGISPHL